MTKQEIIDLLDEMIRNIERGLEAGEWVHVDPDELRAIKAYIESYD